MLLGKVIMKLENSKGNGMAVLVAIQCFGGVYTVCLTPVTRIECIDGIDCGTAA